MKVALTGGNGFLGWHTRARIQARGDDSELIGVGSKFDTVAATTALADADRLVHLAGVNRGTDHEVASGNVLFAQQLAQVLVTTVAPPPVVVFANSIHAGHESPYGKSKSQAADLLRTACIQAGIEFVDVKLPNVFGEGGKPFYNSVVATFSHLLSRGQEPEIHEERELTLLHAQKAASWLLGETTQSERSSQQTLYTVTSLLDALSSLATTYARGEVPNLSTTGQVDLFNTYRSFLVGADMAIRIDQHADNRGSFFEVVRSRGGSGQTSFSTTRPGITRGQHYHLNKVERFTVLAGNARISMRPLHGEKILSFEVNGEQPVSLDMPTLWAHKIENIGTTPLYTMFWTNDIFDPSVPDTYMEEV